MPTKRKRSTSRVGIPIDPNETGPDPQFGELHDLPKGVKRQTSFVRLSALANTTKTEWSRLTFSFPECLGIKETLDLAAKKTVSCIPSVNMDVPINLPVIKNIQIDEVQVSRRFSDNFNLEKATGNLYNYVKKQERAYIVTGDDQLTKEAPDMKDETKKTEVSSYAQMAALSDTIYAKFVNFPTPSGDTEFASVVAPPSWKEGGWIYGKSVDGVQGIDYKDVAQRYLQPDSQPNEYGTTFEMNNILAKGHLLLKDHVNLFVRTKIDDFDGLELRIMIDYTTRSVSLSSLLVWQQQLTEFLPKQVRWRVLEQLKGDTKNGWNILVSRGTVGINGKGNDPTSKTDFPDIKD